MEEGSRELWSRFHRSQQAWERQEQDAEHMKETMKIPSQGEEAQGHGQAQQEEIWKEKEVKQCS